MTLQLTNVVQQLIMVVSFGESGTYSYKSTNLCAKTNLA